MHQVAHSWRGTLTLPGATAAPGTPPEGDEPPSGGCPFGLITPGPHVRMARHLFLRLGSRVLIAMGCGERGEVAPRLGGLGTVHTVTIEEPPRSVGQPELPLT